jgi:hypothetical protein
MRMELAMLTPYAVRFRYPGALAAKSEAAAALKACRSIREYARKALLLPV